MEQRCIFCKIVTGEIPSYKVYEDENFIAFLDVFPRVKGHTLIIPKKHYRWVYDVPHFGEYFEVAKKVAVPLKKAVNAEFISFVTLGEEVPHAHIHILPQTNGNIKGIKFTEVLSMKKEELEKLAQQIENSF
jgi:histidine triad (HIT) family protein